MTNALQPAGADYAPQEPDPEHGREGEADDRDHVDPEEVRPGPAIESDAALRSYVFATADKGKLGFLEEMARSAARLRSTARSSSTCL